MDTDTIAAIATSLSDSGIGIIRISGEDAIEIADRIFVSPSKKHILKDAQSHTIHFGYIADRDEIVDEVLVSVFLAPHSYTGENTAEINCHGGVFLLRKVLHLVNRAGARMAQPGEFTKRAFLNGKMDLSEAEAVMDVISSRNEYALRASVKQLRGSLYQKIRGLREALLYEMAFIESALDDPEHISLDGYAERLTDRVREIKSQIQKLLDTAENGRLIKNGITTVIIGKPNAGKSSLLNLLVGEERAIVTELAGTTRDAIQESVRLRGISLNIVDTAGIRNTEDRVEQIGVERARQYAKDADLILYVADASAPLDENDGEIKRLLQEEAFREKKIIVLLNKSDLEQVVTEKDFWNFWDVENAVRILSTSTKSEEENSGIDAFEDLIEEMFFAGSFREDPEVVITNLRHKEALQESFNSILMLEKSLENGMPEDFFHIDLMGAYTSLGRIIGEELADDLVDEIFSKFCMGK